MHEYMIKSFLHYINKGSCLEIGSYDNAFTLHLLKHFDSVTCVEQDEKMAKLSAKRKLKNVTVINSRIEDVNLGKFDNIFLTHVLEHIETPVSVLKMCRNMLNKGGRIFIAVPNAGAMSRRIAVQMGLVESIEAVTPSEKEHGHKRTYSRETLRADITKSGIKKFHISGCMFKPLSNFQMDLAMECNVFNRKYLDACYELGKDDPELCSSLLAVCEKE